MKPAFPRHTRITGTGSCLPPRRVSNAELVRQLAGRGIETSDDWIVERTGIRARHFADDGVCASDLALPAARHARYRRVLKPLSDYTAPACRRIPTPAAPLPEFLNTV